jgi:hypothetical protein
MKRWILAAFFAPFGPSCKAPEKVVEAHLHEKYGEPFAVQSSHLVPGTGAYELQVIPVRNPDLSFRAEYTRKSGIVNDFYPQTRWHAEAHESFAGLVGDASPDIPHALHTRLLVTYTPDPGALPTFEDLRSHHADAVGVHLHLYLFAEPSPASLPGLLALDRDLRGEELDEVAFIVHFYAPSTLEGRTPDHLPLGFAARSAESFEELRQDALLGVVRYRIDAATPDSPSPARILGRLSPTETMTFDRL